MLCLVKQWKTWETELYIRLISNKRDYLKWTSKPSYMSQKLFENDLIAIRKRKDTLKLNKPAYAGMSISDLSKVIDTRVPLCLH